MTEDQIKEYAKKPFPNDEFKQQAIIDAINWATKELEEENNKLLDVINNQDVKIADLEKKNTELKIQNTNAILKGLEMQVAKDSHRDRANKIQDQLTKAKKIIKKCMEVIEIADFEYTKEYKQAAQFLKEIEK